MKVIVRVRYKSSASDIEKFGDNRYLVKVISDEENANSELKVLFSRYFGVPPSKISVFNGRESNDKILLIE